MPGCFEIVYGLKPSRSLEAVLTMSFLLICPILGLHCDIFLHEVKKTKGKCIRHISGHSYFGGHETAVWTTPRGGERVVTGSVFGPPRRGGGDPERHYKPGTGCLRFSLWQSCVPLLGVRTFQGRELRGFSLGITRDAVQRRPALT